MRTSSQICCQNNSIMRVQSKAVKICLIGCKSFTGSIQGRSQSNTANTQSNQTKNSKFILKTNNLNNLVLNKLRRILVMKMAANSTNQFPLYQKKALKKKRSLRLIKKRILLIQTRGMLNRHIRMSLISEWRICLPGLWLGNF